jgi:hypothetical protein
MKNKKTSGVEDLLLGFCEDSVIISKAGVSKEFILKGKNQKDLIQYLIKVNGKNLCQVADHIGKLQQNLFTTLERENLSFKDFLQIYKFSTGESFKTRVFTIDALQGLHHLKLIDVVKLVNAEKRPFLVKCGSLYYKMIIK